MGILAVNDKDALIGARVQHKAPIRNITWLPNSTHLFSGDDHGIVIISHAVSGIGIKQWKCHDTSISAMNAAPERRLLATADVSGLVRVWGYRNPQEAMGDLKLVGEARFDGEVAGLDFRPDGQPELAISDASGAVHLWDPTTIFRPEKIAKLPAQANSAAWSPDARLIAVGCDDFNIHLMDRRGQSITILRGHTHHADQVGFSHCGCYLASGSHDRTVRVWDVHKGVCVQTFVHDLDTVKPDWSKDGRLATCSYDKKVRIFEPLTGRSIAVLRGHTYDVDDVSWSPDSCYIASCGWDNCILIYDAANYALLARIEGATQQVYALAADKSGTELRAGTSAGKVYRIKLHESDEPRVAEIYTPHQGVITSIDFSTDGSRVVSTSSDSSFAIAGIGSEDTQVRVFHQHHNLDLDVARFSTCGRYLATGARDNSVVLYSLQANGVKELALLHHERRVKALSWAPTRPHFATGSDGNVRIFDAESAELVHEWRAHERMINSVEWTPDGECLLTACWDRTIRLFKADGTALLTFEGSRYNVNSIAVHPNATTLASACWDGTISIWHIPTGVEIDRVSTPDSSPVHIVRWLPNENLAISTWGGSVLLYDTSKHSFVANMQLGAGA